MGLFQLKIVLTQFKRQVARNACTKGGESTDPCVVRDVMLPRSCSCGVNFGLCSITHPRQRRRLGSAIELCMPTYCRCTVCSVSCISETCSLIDVITPCRDVNSYNQLNSLKIRRNWRIHANRGSLFDFSNQISNDFERSGRLLQRLLLLSA